MPISLPRTLRDTLVTRIAECLRSSDIASGASLRVGDDMWTLHNLVSAGSPTDQRLRPLLGDCHVSDFVIHELHRKHIGSWIQGHPLRSFCDVLGTNAPLQWAEQVTVSLESLPWQYTAYVRLPASIDPGLIGTSGLDLTPTHSLVPNNLVPESPTGSGLASLAAVLGDARRTTGEPAIYLKMEVEGYLPDDRESLGASQVIASVLSIFGVCLSLRIFSHSPWHFATKTPPSYNVDVYRRSDEQKHYNGSINFDPSTAREMEKIINIISPTPEANAVRTLALLRTLGNVMERADSRLLNAARWYFDSHCGSSDQVRFVQVCIALEILLGDEKQGRETGLSNLMANRCAYLLGKNGRERENIASGFKKGYDIRSRIVHAGKSLLSSEEKGHFNYMQGLCAAVIRKECFELEQ